MTFLVALIEALVMVESAGNCEAIGDNGSAIGPLQIRPFVIEDVNAIFDLNPPFIADDARDPNKARKICALYITHWARHYEARHHTAPTPEICARIWNGGPYGPKKQSTLQYWQKVEQAMQANEQKEKT